MSQELDFKVVMAGVDVWDYYPVSLDEVRFNE
jgi:hypothetical protein